MAPRIYQLALRLLGSETEAEDVLQEVCLRAVRHLRTDVSFREQQTWLYRVAANVARDRLKTEARRREREAKVQSENAAVPVEPDAELVGALRAAMGMLEHDYRLPLFLCYEQDLSQREAAAVMGIPERTVSDRLRIGLEKLRRALAQAGFSVAASALLAGLKQTAPAVPSALVGQVQALLAKGAGSRPAGGSGAAAAAKGGLAMKVFAGIVLAGALAGGVAMLLQGSGGPAASEPQLDPPFIISLWCGPDRKHTTVEDYRAVADCGFNLVLPPGDGWAVDLKTNRQILDICQQVGLKAMIADSRLVNGEGRHRIKPADPDFAKTLDAVVADYAAHPALAGYYISDEPSAKDFPDLADIFRRLREKDPKHFAYVNLFPSYAGNDRLGSKSFEDHVATFVEKVQPAIVSWDHYEQMSGNKGPAYFSDLEDVRKVCVKSGTPYFQIILATPHFAFRDPSEADLRWQVYTTLCYGARGIMYFIYWPYPPFGTDAIINRDGSRGAKYDMVKRINARLKALAPTLVKLKSAGVYHSEPLPKGTAKLAADAPVRKMEGGEMVLGWLKDGAGGDYVFVVNRSFKDKLKAQLTLDAAVKKAEEISQETGQPVAAALTAGVLSCDLEAGEGRLFRLGK
jgi:RNA polymerase sigma factor (sigma-70 family)